MATSETQLHDCIRSSYGVDEKHTQLILSYLQPYLNDPHLQSAFDELIQKSGRLNIPFDKEMPPSTVHPLDAMQAAPDWHEVLFESPYVRILWASSEPGETDTPHLHPYKSLFLMLQAPEFDVVNFDGTHERGIWPAGFYEFPPEETPSSYTNLGPCSFAAILFEIKAP